MTGAGSGKTQHDAILGVICHDPSSVPSPCIPTLKTFYLSAAFCAHSE